VLPKAALSEIGKTQKAKMWSKSVHGLGLLSPESGLGGLDIFTMPPNCLSKVE
jgi:hypothetical protein